jgi:hypothetical protein
VNQQIAFKGRRPIGVRFWAAREPVASPPAKAGRAADTHDDPEGLVDAAALRRILGEMREARTQAAENR